MINFYIHVVWIYGKIMPGTTIKLNNPTFTAN